MAMLSAMMNAKTPVTNLSETNGAKTEMVAPILIDLEELDEMTTIAPDFLILKMYKLKRLLVLLI